MGNTEMQLCRFENAVEYGFYGNNYAADTDDIFEMGQMTLTLKYCYFAGTLGAFRMQRDTRNGPMTVNIYSTNTFVGSVNIEETEVPAPVYSGGIVVNNLT